MNIRCVCTEGVFNDCGTELNDRRIIDTLGDLCFLCALLLSLELALNGVDILPMALVIAAFVARTGTTSIPVVTLMSSKM